jgi:indole-3-glycerol phosphate synthase
MTSEGTYLDRIIAAKRESLSQTRAANVSEREIEAMLASLPPALDFMAALKIGPGPRAIAEFKRASPSEGEIRPGADPKHVATLYVDAGAACISVLTDAHFEGSIDDLSRVRSAVSVPILRKDFILQRSQIIEARREGADAILLIVAALEPPRLRELMSFAHRMGLQVLCEAHDEREIERALAAGAKMVGVNNRDLKTFEVDVGRCIELRKLVPRDGFMYVAESGIQSREDVARLREAGVDAFLVGTHLMRAEDPGLALMDLLGLAGGGA